MKTLLLPLIIIILPFLTLFLILKYWMKRRAIPLVASILIAMVFIPVGVLSSVYAMNISIQGMRADGIRCFIGAIVYIPLGLFFSSIGIPVLLFNFKTPNKLRK